MNSGRQDNAPPPVLDYRSSADEAKASIPQSFKLCRRSAGDDRAVTILKWIIVLALFVLARLIL